MHISYGLVTWKVKKVRSERMSAWLDLGLIPVSAFLFDEEPDNIFKTVRAVMCSAMFPYFSFADTSLLLWPNNRCLN